MSDQNDGMPLIIQLLENGHDVEATFRIQCPRRFIGKDDFAAIHQGTRNTDTLLLTAGQFGRKMVDTVAQFQIGEDLVGAFFSFLGFQA